MLWVYDTEVVRDRIAEILPVFWDVLAQEGEHLLGEFSGCGVTPVVRHMLVQHAPQPLDRVQMGAVSRGSSSTLLATPFFRVLNESGYNNLDRHFFLSIVSTAT